MARWPAGQASCLHVLMALVAVVPCAVAQSTCRVQLIGTGTRLTVPTATAGAVQSGSVRCTGPVVKLTGPIALRELLTFAGATILTILTRWSASCRPCLRQKDDLGPARCDGFAVHFTGATFTVDPSAPGLLTFSSGAQVRYSGHEPTVLAGLP